VLAPEPGPASEPTVTDDLDPPTPAPAADTWEAILDALRRRYPGQKDSVLFCIYKLQQNPDLTLRDFGAEAKLYGIPMAGRALYSARQILGLVGQEAARASMTLPEAPPPHRSRGRGPRPEMESGESIENKVLAAVRQIQSAAGAQSDGLREAIRQAVAILQRALGE
jgi:hypothetical protein